MESELGLSGGTLAALATQDPVEGSGIFAGLFPVLAGDVISFDWNFLTDEIDADDDVNDFAFYHLGIVGVLADVLSGTFLPSGSSYFHETGFQHFSYVVGVGGFASLA